MNQNEIIISELLQTNLRSDLENAKKQLKGLKSKTESLMNRELEKRERIRCILEGEKKIKKVELNNTRFVGKDPYPFVTKEEKRILFDMLDEAKAWGNKEYSQQQKHLSNMYKRLNLANENIKSMKKDLKRIDENISSITGRMRKLEK